MRRSTMRKALDQHNVGAMVGYEQMKYNTNYFQASRTDFPSIILDQLDAGSLDKNKQANNGLAGVTSRQNYFGRLTYDYNHKYLAQLIFRYDGSPQFPEDKQWGFFPGASVGWRISEESFMDNITVVDELKLRASYGEMGNDNVPAFQYISAYKYGEQLCGRRYGCDRTYLRRRFESRDHLGSSEDREHWLRCVVVEWCFVSSV